MLVVGLGNPGREYAANRHNLGYMVVDELARRHGGSFRGKFSGRLAESRIGEKRVALLKPETYMNESGVSVGAAARFFKLEPGEVVVVHDEGDFELGRIQARLGGGLAGHNGLKSLRRELGGADFMRVRVGVGRPASSDPEIVSSYVLGRFRESHEQVGGLIDRACEAVERIVLGDGE